MASSFADFVRQQQSPQSTGQSGFAQFVQRRNSAAIQPTDSPAPEAKKDPGLFKKLDEPAYDLTNQGLSATNVAKSGANTLKSLFKFGKGVVDFFNPKNTFEALKQIPGAIVETAKSQQAAEESAQKAKALEQKVKEQTGKAPTVNDPDNKTGIASNLKSIVGGAYQATVPPALQKLFKGKATESLQSVAEDPYQLAPLFLMGKGLMETKFGTYDPANPTAQGKALIDTKTGQAIDSAVSATANTVIKPTKSIVNAAGNTARATGNFAVSQTTGLSPETIKTIKEQPSRFSPSEIAKSDRTGLVTEVKDTITNRLADLSETGKGYQIIRDSGQTATVKPSWIAESLKSNGWSDGNIAIDANGVARPSIKPTKLANISNAEQAALQKFMDVWGNKKTLTAEEFLDGRKFLDSWSKWQQEVASTDQGKALFRQLRSDFNDAARGQFKGLAELDAKYGPEAQQLRQIQSEYLNSDGSLKDSASSKLANLTNKGREQALARLEEISPGITQKIRVLKAIEDIHNASGQKVGTYVRAAIGGAGIVTLNPGAILAAIVTNPAIATQILRAYGAALKVKDSVIQQVIKSFQESNQNPNVGLSVTW